MKILTVNLPYLEMFFKGLELTMLKKLLIKKY